MPLLRGKNYEPKSRPPAGCGDHASLFHLELTNELFSKYQNYLAFLNLYRQRIWIDAITRRENLTYREAIEAERVATLARDAFPTPTRAAIAHLVHGATLPAATLLPRMFELLRDYFLPGEQVDVMDGDYKGQTLVVAPSSPLAPALMRPLRNQHDLEPANEEAKDDNQDEGGEGGAAAATTTTAVAAALASFRGNDASLLTSIQLPPTYFTRHPPPSPTTPAGQELYHLVSSTSSTPITLPGSLLSRRHAPLTLPLVLEFLATHAEVIPLAGLKKPHSSPCLWLMSQQQRLEHNLDARHASSIFPRHVIEAIRAGSARGSWSLRGGHGGCPATALPAEVGSYFAPIDVSGWSGALRSILAEGLGLNKNNNNDNQEEEEDEGALQEELAVWGLEPSNEMEWSEARVAVHVDALQSIRSDEGGVAALQPSEQDSEATIEEPIGGGGGGGGEDTAATHPTATPPPALAPLPPGTAFHPPPTFLSASSIAPLLQSIFFAPPNSSILNQPALPPPPAAATAPLLPTSTSSHVETRDQTERRLTPGTVKRAIYEALKDVGREGITIADLLAKIRRLGFGNCLGGKTPKNTVSSACNGDRAFARVGPGRYCLRCLPGVNAIAPPPNVYTQTGGRNEGGGGGGGGGGGNVASSSGAAFLAGRGARTNEALQGVRDVVAREGEAISVVLRAVAKEADRSQREGGNAELCAVCDEGALIHGPSNRKRAREEDDKMEEKMEEDDKMEEEEDLVGAGFLLLCDSCPRSYHPQCLRAPMAWKNVSSDDFVCDKCRDRVMTLAQQLLGIKEKRQQLLKTLVVVERERREVEKRRADQELGQMARV